MLFESRCDAIFDVLPARGPPNLFALRLRLAGNGRFAGRRAFATGGYRAPCGDRPKGEGMIGRLGEVLYWIAVGLGAILALLGIALLIFGVDLTAKFMGGVSIVAGIWNR
jgi:hypothetical protein